ncbi:hypothetical protein [Nostoc favosum]|uniref:Transposase n=1 Tax=Nostoc favosum CHAB5714 TaxID=2780399 RepID=A0ABS8I7K0_9NOSO|nr:hypothetical protein [Nostoc favosum]MCC5599836.1 hypothetical protein [Nostoc favosum CHAB5714]
MSKKPIERIHEFAGIVLDGLIGNTLFLKQNLEQKYRGKYERRTNGKTV